MDTGRIQATTRNLLNRLRYKSAVQNTAERILPYNSRRLLDLYNTYNGADLGRFLGSRLPRLERHALEAHLLSIDAITVEIERGGIKWKARSGDEIFRHVYATGGYSSLEINSLLEWCKNARPASKWFIDIGANIGTTTIPFASNGFSVLAIEPDPIALSFLEHNLKKNQLDHKVSTSSHAIHQLSGTQQLAQTRGLGNNELIPGVGEITTKSDILNIIPVETEGLDSIIEAYSIPTDDVAAVWCDAQGSEGDVVVTGKQLWAAGIPLYSELWPAALDRHFGLDNYIEAVESHFSQFITSRDLLQDPVGVTPKPISNFRHLVNTLISQSDWTDVLLIPELTGLRTGTIPRSGNS